MLILQNDQLTVELLDPRTDEALLGARYNGGGYIHQVRDHRAGPLMSGPTYPASFNTFDGQGIPDSFALAPLPTEVEGEVLILGVGVCSVSTGTVIRRSAWDVRANASMTTFVTHHETNRWNVAVARSVSLEGRTIRSSTRVTNHSRERLSFVWFPHPFFPQFEAGTDDLFAVTFPVSIAPNPSYEIAPNGFVRRTGWPWTDGRYQPLEIPLTGTPVILQRHPAIGLLAAICDWTPTYFPIWGNPNAFSWEPMIERTVGVGQSVDWRIAFHF